MTSRMDGCAWKRRSLWTFPALGSSGHMAAPRHASAQAESGREEVEAAAELILHSQTPRSSFPRGAPTESCKRWCGGAALASLCGTDFHYRTDSTDSWWRGSTRAPPPPGGWVPSRRSPSWFCASWFQLWRATSRWVLWNGCGWEPRWRVHVQCVNKRGRLARRGL